ncbi:MAG TPA: hypothetical protein VGL53_01990 [Bryobacteraceae bacterium]
MSVMKSPGMISAKAAFLAYIVLATLALTTLDGDMRKYVLIAIALFAVKTYVDILRRRIAANEEAEAAAAESAASPLADVSSSTEP